jgi:hypothetical protein
MSARSICSSSSSSSSSSSRLRSLALALAVALTSIALTTVASCSKDGGSSKAAPAQQPQQQPTADKGHAPAGVKPGSHEDWCAEHQVPESQCTRCSPDLVPAFKATNDWCAEHGLPESQCKICNPEIVITRPPKGA